MTWTDEEGWPGSWLELMKKDGQVHDIFFSFSSFYLINFLNNLTLIFIDREAGR